MRCLLIMILVWFAAGPMAVRSDQPPAAESLEALVDRTLAAYGGDALPRPGQMFRLRGRNWSNRLQSEGTMLRELRWPDYLRVELDYANGVRESRLLANGRGWYDGDPAPEPMIRAMRLQAARLALPMLLQWEAAELRDLGEAVRGDGIAVRRLAVGLGDGLTLYVEIDRREARILRSAGVMPMGQSELSFGAEYSDFGPLGPVSWARHEDQAAMGQPTGWTRLEGIEMDLPLRRDALQP